MKTLSATLAITRMILCRQGHIFCFTTKGTTIIKSSFGCNSSNKHFMRPLIQHPIQCLQSSSGLYILMASEISLAAGFKGFIHARKFDFFSHETATINPKWFCKLSNNWDSSTKRLSGRWGPCLIIRKYWMCCWWWWRCYLRPHARMVLHVWSYKNIWNENCWLFTLITERQCD